ncbi:MAG: hypothetical protein ACXW2T_07650 [Allosphingosinicella sp.]
MAYSPYLPWLCGVLIALAVSAFAALVGLDRDRSFYPTVLIVIAVYYDLFAVMSGSTAALMVEIVASLPFAAVAVIGFRRSPWIVAAGLAAHGVFDYFHADLIENPGVPAWWPAWCLAYDIAAAACLAWIIVSRQGSKGDEDKSSSRAFR